MYKDNNYKKKDPPETIKLREYELLFVLEGLIASSPFSSPSACYPASPKQHTQLF